MRPAAWTIRSLIAAFLLLAPPIALAQLPAVAGEVCGGCHGAGGVSLNPLVPTLAGQPYTLIEDNLLALRGGKRACAPERGDGSPAAALAHTMCSFVRDLRDEDISALARAGWQRRRRRPG